MTHLLGSLYQAHFRMQTSTYCRIQTKGVVSIALLKKNVEKIMCNLRDKPSIPDWHLENTFLPALLCSRVQTSFVLHFYVGRARSTTKLRQWRRAIGGGGQIPSSAGFFKKIPLFIGHCTNWILRDCLRKRGRVQLHWLKSRCAPHDHDDVISMTTQRPTTKTDFLCVVFCLICNDKVWVTWWLTMERDDPQLSWHIQMKISISGPI